MTTEIDDASDVLGDPYAAGLRLVQQHGTAAVRPEEFDLLGLRWDLLPGVFAPTRTASTELFSDWLPYPAGGRFLEIGSGTGVTAVTAALRGCARVNATDIAAAAVDNTRLNAARHQVADRVQALRSDLFDGLAPGERYDVIFWNSNVVEAPDDFEYVDDIQWAIFDRGYTLHERYLRDGMARLTRTGRLFLGFNSLGNVPLLTGIADRLGLRIVPLARTTRRAGAFPVEFQLLELHREE
ncbi:methyltransferase [Streptomyces sp. NPDC051569]|uniref:methyltransferase n=1 Tax=Streptomyces sp. NPDC051569 TaxID=3365661 RepID=UPI00378A27DE